MHAVDMQFSGKKKTLILDWPSEAKRKVTSKERALKSNQAAARYSKHIILRPSPRVHVLSLRRFPVVFSIVSIVLVFILLFCFV